VVQTDLQHLFPAHQQAYLAGRLLQDLDVAQATLLPLVVNVAEQLGALGVQGGQFFLSGFHINLIRKRNNRFKVNVFSLIFILIQLCLRPGTIIVFAGGHLYPSKIKLVILRGAKG